MSASAGAANWKVPGAGAGSVAPGAKAARAIVIRAGLAGRDGWVKELSTVPSTCPVVGIEEA